MESLSIAIITFNEENNIGRCIDSVAEIADEIVVVDSFSTDRTEEICKSKGVTFLQNPFEGHVEQKNYILTKCTHSLILSIDADEVVSPELKKEILKIKENRKADAYFINRLNNYCGKWIKHSGWYPDKKVRLFDRTKVQWGGENPHDKIIVEEGATTDCIKKDILHYTYPDISAHINQLNKFTSISAEQCFKKGKKVNFFVHIILYPFSTFITKYFFKLGFLDGKAGFLVCISTAYYRFLKYSKLYELYQTKNAD